MALASTSVVAFRLERRSFLIPNCLKIWVVVQQAGDVCGAFSQPNTESVYGQLLSTMEQLALTRYAKLTRSTDELRTRNTCRAPVNGKQSTFNAAYAKSKPYFNSFAPRGLAGHLQDCIALRDEVASRCRTITKVHTGAHARSRRRHRCGNRTALPLRATGTPVTKSGDTVDTGNTCENRDLHRIETGKV